MRYKLKRIENPFPLGGIHWGTGLGPRPEGPRSGARETPPVSRQRDARLTHDPRYSCIGPSPSSRRRTGVTSTRPSPANSMTCGPPLFCIQSGSMSRVPARLLQSTEFPRMSATRGATGLPSDTSAVQGGATRSVAWPDLAIQCLVRRRGDQDQHVVSLR